MIKYANYTQHQKILTLMCKFPDKQWWLASDFQLPEQGELFVGYEATARLTELSKRYPEMIESVPHGKFIKRRVRFETIKSWLPTLPKELRYIFHRTGHTAELNKTLGSAHDAPATGSQAAGADDIIVEPEKPKRYTKYRATYLGHDLQGIDLEKPRGVTFDIAIEKLTMGQPIEVLVKKAQGRKPLECRYKDVKTFRKYWKVL